jgi:hypothetical protein
VPQGISRQFSIGTRHIPVIAGSRRQDKRPASGTPIVLVSHKQQETPLVTTYRDGIWAADQYGTAGPAARICHDDGHSAAGHGPWRQSEVDGALTRMVPARRVVR